MHCNNLGLVLGLGLVRVSSRVRVRVKVSVMVRVSIRTSWVVNFALFRCYRPVIYTRPIVLKNNTTLIYHVDSCLHCPRKCYNTMRITVHTNGVVRVDDDNEQGLTSH